VIAKLLLPALLTLATTAALAAGPAPTPQLASTTGTTPVLHCQVPCGVYGDRMRIDMLMEDAATIEKGMNELAKEETSSNQMVRWVLTKDQHAASIQETVASYWLAQRIKAPAEEGEAAREAYHRQLELLHGITVAAMKCKQTTDVANVARVRALALEFSATYFSEEDLEHIQSHHASEGR
jgi:hypothetical protein